MKKKINLNIKFKLNKRLIIMIVINILLLLIGFIYPSLIKKEIISTKLTTYIENLLNSNYPIDSLIKTNLINNLFENFSLYIFTILLFSFPVVLLLYFLKTFTLGASITSIIYIYKVKGVLYSLIVLFPTLLNLLVLSISFYFSLSYFIIKLKYRKKVSKRKLLKSYIKVFLVTSLIQILISFIDGYLSFYFFKFI